MVLSEKNSCCNSHIFKISILNEAIIEADALIPVFNVLHLTIDLFVEWCVCVVCLYMHIYACMYIENEFKKYQDFWILF